MLEVGLHGKHLVKLLLEFHFKLRFYRRHCTRRSYCTVQYVHMELVYLQSNQLIHGDGSVAEGDGVAEAGLSLDCPLRHVHDDLWALGAGVKEQREGGQAPARLRGQAAFGLVVASVRCGRKRSVQRIYAEQVKKNVTESHNRN